MSIFTSENFLRFMLHLVGFILFLFAISYVFKGLKLMSKDKKLAKKALIIAGVCFLVGIGMCGNYSNL